MSETSPRLQIIERVIGRLKAAGSTAGDRVTPDPLRALTVAGLAEPRIMVLVDEEEIVEYTPGDGYRRRLSLLLVGLARADEGLGSLLEGLALAMEQTMAADPGLGGLALDSQLNQTSFDYLTEYDWLVGSVTLTYAIDYFTP